MEKEYKYLVVTQCMTYNQSEYIEDALNGFAIQETTYPVVFVVVDDKSTDGEQVVLKRWAKENIENDDGTSEWKEMPYGALLEGNIVGKPFSTMVFLLLNQNYYKSGKNVEKFEIISSWLDNAKYNAICEGDDYWISPHKLQMQIEFMETHPDYALCHTDFDLANGKRRNHTCVSADNDVFFPYSIIHGLRIGTATAFFRTETIQRCPKLFNVNQWPMSDYPLWIELSHEGKVKFIPIITACYRVVENSFSHGSLEKEIAFANANLEIKRFYAHYYGIHLPNDGFTKGFYLRIMKCAHKHGSKDVAINCLKNAYRKKMLSLKTIVFFMATYSKIVNKVIGLYWS